MMEKFLYRIIRYFDRVIAWVAASLMTAGAVAHIVKGNTAGAVFFGFLAVMTVLLLVFSAGETRIDDY